MGCFDNLAGCSKSSKGEGSIQPTRDADTLLEKLNTLLEMVVEELKERMKEREERRKEREERREWRKKRKITTDEQAPSVADALAKINSMPDLVSEAPVFSFARSMMIRDPNKRIILMCLPNDTSRLRWIKYLYVKMSKEK